MSDSVSLGEPRPDEPAAGGVDAEPATAQQRMNNTASRRSDADASADADDARHRWLAESFDRYERPLLAYACRMLGADFSAAQDVVQETFMRLCREDPDKIGGRLAAWLFTVCRSRVIDMKRHRGVLPTSEHAAAVVDHAPDPAAAVEADEQTDQLAALLETLSPRQQEVLRLRLQADLSYREIAEVTGLSVSNVGFHLHAAVRSLRGTMLGSPSPEQ